jgi:SAM-dependent methyltransferase
MSRLTNQTYLKTHQYKNADNLQARIALHERFNVNPYDWHLWVFDQFKLPQEASLLEVGAGTGRLWRQNLSRLPAGWQITLSDFSDGMLQQAQENLHAAPQFDFDVIDVQQIPWADSSCDAVIANHMLYHVPNREQALQEIHRILKPGGKLYAATNGATHLQELYRLMSQVVPSRDSFSDPFQLENGAQQLSEHFADVTCHLYDNALRITELKPLVMYILSKQDAEIEAKIDELSHLIEQQLKTQGAIYVTKSTGLFEAQK